MFDLRYHAASLAAVFLALVIGILVGVGLASRGSISNPERTRYEGTIADLNRRVASLGKDKAALADTLQALNSYAEATYPVVAEDRLLGKRVGLVFVGPVDGSLRGEVADALAPTGALAAMPIRSLKVPIDVTAVDGSLAGRPAFARFEGDAQLEALGAALGRQLALRGDTQLWNALAGQLVEERSGSLDRALDAIVLVRSAQPQAGPTARYLRGLYRGLAGSGVPVVGVEDTSSRPSAVKAFVRAGLTMVDDLDSRSGQLALVLALAGGGRPGAHYGVKDGAESVVPVPLEPVATIPGG